MGTAERTMVNSMIGDIDPMIESWHRHIEAGNLSLRTLEAYIGACRQFAKYLRAQGMPTDVSAIKREHVEAFIVDLLANWKPATAVNQTS